MPLSFEKFQGEEGVFGLSSFFNFNHKTHQTKFRQELLKQEKQDLTYVLVGTEPTSVLDSLRSPSPLLSHSSTTTLSSSHNGATTDDNNNNHNININNNDKCSLMSTLDDSHLIMDPTFFDPGFTFGSGSVTVSDTPNPIFLPFQEPFPNPNPNHFSPPPAKRFNSGPIYPFPDLDPDPGRLFQFPSSSSHVQAPCSVMAEDDQTVIIKQLFNAAELITNDQTILAQGILARLNHHLINLTLNAPFSRTASYISQTLLSLTNHENQVSSSTSPESLLLRIAAYRAFSDTSPFLQFVNFTSNQTILECCEGFDRIHIVDFDIGYGGQWSSLMQELARGGRKSLKITVFASPPSNITEEFELRFTDENLKSFALEVKIPFEIELLSVELLLNPSYWPVLSTEKEALVVNLPLNSVVSGYFPLVLRYVKQLGPNVVVCSERGCDCNDQPFGNAVVRSLEYYTGLVESLDGDCESVERFWVKPSIEKGLMKRYRWIERCFPWKSLFMQCGFSSVGLSSMAESQAECLLQRNVVRGFGVEKRGNGSLALCWQRKELVNVSAWKC